MIGLPCHPWEVPRLLDGSLTVLVRPVEKQYDGGPDFPLIKVFRAPNELGAMRWKAAYNSPYGPPYSHFIQCPFPAVGERFYVKEPWSKSDLEEKIYYEADGDWREFCWQPARTMKKEFSRCKPEVVSVRVAKDFNKDLSCNPLLKQKIVDAVNGRSRKYNPIPSTFLDDLEKVDTFRKSWAASYPDLPLEHEPWVWVGEVKV